jgi:hypothetical protein
MAVLHCHISSSWFLRRRPSAFADLASGRGPRGVTDIQNQTTTILRTRRLYTQDLEFVDGNLWMLRASARYILISLGSLENPDS